MPTAARSVPTGGLKSSAHRTGFRSVAGTESKARSNAGSTPATRADTTLPSGRRHVGWPGNSLAFVTTHPSAPTIVPRLTATPAFSTTTTLERVGSTIDRYRANDAEPWEKSAACRRALVGQFAVGSDAFLAVVRGDLSTAHRVKQRVDELASRDAA